MADRPEEPRKGSQGHVEGSNGVLEQGERDVPRRTSSGSTQKPGDIHGQQQQEPPTEEKKPSKWRRLWEKTGLDMATVSMMIKASIPPTVALAMYQADAVAAHYQTLGYLVAIASVLGFCIMPRGKFIQSMTLNVLAICFAAAVNLLALFSVTQARKHTTPPGVPPVGYNSSASAVCAIWLMFQVYFINTVRAARPQFQFPAILCSIFVVVSMTYGVMFPNMSSAISFMKRLLEAFLTGFALATVTSFLIFPTSSRKVVFKEMTGYMQLMNGILKSQTAYMASLETYDPMQKRKEESEQIEKDNEPQKKKNGKESQEIMLTPAAAKMRELLGKLTELHTKLHGDVTPAKREIAVGKLESHDLTELWKKMRAIFLPVIGLTSMINILERGAESFGWGKDDVSEEEDKTRKQRLDSLHFLMKNLHGPFASMTGTLDGAFQHVLLTLDLEKPEKKKKQKQPDEESRGDETPAPGTSGFAEYYEEKVDTFYSSKKKTLEDWCQQNGIALPPDFFDSSFIHPEKVSPGDERVRERHQRQLFFTLYLEYLLWRVGKELLELVLYVDKRKQEGAFKRSKVIFPGSKTLYKWVRSVWNKEDFSREDTFTTDVDAGGAESMYLGASFQKKKDPEHEAPRNTVERMGEAMRAIPKFFRSEESAFGFRVVAATMTIGIVCYLRETQNFFLQQRLLWAMIMVAMSMNRTAGQSIFNFAFRILGTAIAMVGAYVIWYIVDGRVPGVLVFLWLWMLGAFYVLLKMPKYIIVAILSLVTAVLIIGYELQVKKIGEKAVESNGQPAYPTYVLAPYRLATVAGGIFIAFIWTLFPYPISESTELRKDLSASMYIMCAFYENVHETVAARIKGTYDGSAKKGSHIHNLEKARHSFFSKLVLLLNNLETNVAFSRFQIPIGGRFPREEYEALIQCMKRLMLWTSLASYASTTFEVANEGDAERSPWVSELRKIIQNSNRTSHKVTSLLSLLSSSLSHGQPLPPFLEMPEPFQFARRLNEIDRDILSIRHVVEPEYSAVAVLQIVSTCIDSDIRKLVGHARNLVGEIDFSYRGMNSTSVGSVDSTEESEDDKSKFE